MRTRPVLALTAVVALALAGGAQVRDRSSPADPSPAAQVRGTDPDADDAVTAERLQALREAKTLGTLGRTGPIASNPAPGWAGETLLDPKADDWEPAIAADPNAPYVYVVHNRYGGSKACPNSCPDPAMILSVSRDGGRTFGADRFLCVCRNVQGQFDPLVEVVPDTGAVYAAWMNDFNVVFSASLDHGATWSVPVRVYGNVAWADKPILAESRDGRDVYVAFNGPTGGDGYVAVSHDAGETWTQVRTSHSKRYFFAYGGYVGPDGAVAFTEISFTYSGPGGSAEGSVAVHALTSNDGGATWANTVVDTLELGTPCVSAGCYADFYDSGPALAGDAVGDLMIVYGGAAAPGGPRTVYARSSTDHGATWGPRATLSPAGKNAGFPAAVGTGNGEVRVWFMDQRSGRWNTWYTTSSDLGATWSAPVRISDATSGTAYKDADGFAEVYGDYGEIAITSAGGTVAVWGEGPSYNGPGGVWLNRER